MESLRSIIFCRQARHMLFLFVTVGLVNPSVQAQTLPSTQPEKTDTRKGNKQFQKENYTDAEADYKKALDKKSNMPEASFNLGDAIYEQKRYEDAAKQFQTAVQNSSDPKVKAKAYHNLGNSYLAQRKWEDAINSYKQALRLNDKDNDTKYNLAYANAMMVQQKNQQKKNDQNKDKKDKKDDQKNQQNQKPDQKQDNQQGKNGDKNQQQQKQGAQAKLSKEDAEKLLQALMNEEQKTNQKMQQKTARPVNAKIEKDW